MRYVGARFNIAKREEAYRFFIGDAVRILTENTAKIANGGTYIEDNIRDIVYPKPKPEEDKRSCAEIVAEMWARPTPTERG